MWALGVTIRDRIVVATWLKKTLGQPMTAW